MASLIKKHETRLKKMLKGGVIFGDPVPTQRDPSNPPDDAIITHGGELRGFYPSRFTKGVESVKHGRWFPLNSEQHDSKSTEPPVHRAHNGIDLYAPYVPFPYEVPVLALADGELFFSYWSSNQNAIGSQAALHLIDRETFGLYRYRLIYGHLNRFRPVNLVRWKEGAPGTRYANPVNRTMVKQGDVVGYIGISGNADTKGEASTRESPAGVSSCHIHLTLARTKKGVKGKTIHDPLAVLDINVDKVALANTKPDPDNPEDPTPTSKPPTGEAIARPPATYWKSKNLNREHYGEPRYHGTTLKMAQEPKVKGIVIPAKKRLSVTRPNVPPWPFHGLNLDQHGLLQKTVKAYGVIKAGLTGNIGPYTRAMLDAQDAVLAPVDATTINMRAGITLSDLQARAIAAADPKKYDDPDRAGRVTAALLHLIEGQYALLGGPGFEAPGTERKKYAHGLVACGVGVQGRLTGVASVGKRQANTHFTPELAMGYTHLTWKIADGAIYPEYAAVSVGLGAGSGREATLSAQTILDFEKKRNAATDPAEKAGYAALYKYCEHFYSAVYLDMRNLLDGVVKKRVRLIGSQAGSKAEWERFCDDVAAATESQRAGADVYFSDAMNTDLWHQRLWSGIAAGALEVVQETAEIAKKPASKKGKKPKSNETIPAQPEMRLLYSETPPPSAG